MRREIRTKKGAFGMQKPSAPRWRPFFCGAGLPRFCGIAPIFRFPREPRPSMQPSPAGEGGRAQQGLMRSHPWHPAWPVGQVAFLAVRRTCRFPREPRPSMQPSPAGEGGRAQQGLMRSHPWHPAWPVGQVAFLAVRRTCRFPREPRPSMQPSPAGEGGRAQQGRMMSHPWHPAWPVEHGLTPPLLPSKGAPLDPFSLARSLLIARLRPPGAPMRWRRSSWPSPSCRCTHTPLPDGPDPHRPGRPRRRPHPA